MPGFQALLDANEQALTANKEAVHAAIEAATQAGADGIAAGELAAAAADDALDKAQEALDAAAAAGGGATYTGRAPTADDPGVLGNIDAGSITSGYLGANRIAAASLTATVLAADTLTSREIGADAILARNIKAEQVTTAAIAASTITGDKSRPTRSPRARSRRRRSTQHEHFLARSGGEATEDRRQHDHRSEHSGWHDGPSGASSLYFYGTENSLGARFWGDRPVLFNGAVRAADYQLTDGTSFVSRIPSTGYIAATSDSTGSQTFAHRLSSTPSAVFLQVKAPRTSNELTVRVVSIWATSVTVAWFYNGGSWTNQNSSTVGVFWQAVA